MTEPKGAWVPADLLNKCETPNEVAMLVAICRYHGDKGCWASVDTLAKTAALSRATAFRVISDMEGRVFERSGFRHRCVIRKLLTKTNGRVSKDSPDISADEIRQILTPKKGLSKRRYGS